jgi:hypothetical protein
MRAEKLRELRKAMGSYVLKVLANAEDDEASVEQVRQALQPIDAFRAGALARRNAGGGSEEPTPAPTGDGSVVHPAPAPAPTPLVVPPAPNGHPS